MGAVITTGGKYRYILWRDLPSPTIGTCLFIMLNPSTATATKDDPTIRRCRSFAEREGCNRLEVVNLFAYRATNPHQLKLLSREQIFGPLNLRYIHEAVMRADVIIAGWGAHASLHGVDKYVLSTIDKPVYCLGKTSHGKPRHPLYVRGDQPLEILKP